MFPGVPVTRVVASLRSAGQAVKKAREEGPIPASPEAGQVSASVGGAVSMVTDTALGVVGMVRRYWWAVAAIVVGVVVWRRRR